MLRNLIKGKKEEGFTIIEVMIVLAIAGLIIVVVLIAVPQLQRNQRNQARQSIAQRIVTEINNYAGNNNGVYPIDATTSNATNFASPVAALGFFNRYLGCDTSRAADDRCTANINDPQTGFPVGTTSNGTVASINTTGSSAPGSTAGDLLYRRNVVCSGETLTTGSGNRSFALMIRLEGNAIYCLDNQ